MLSLILQQHCEIVLSKQQRPSLCPKILGLTMDSQETMKKNTQINHNSDCFTLHQLYEVLTCNKIIFSKAFLVGTIQLSDKKYSN